MVKEVYDDYEIKKDYYYKQYNSENDLLIIEDVNYCKYFFYKIQCELVLNEIEFWEEKAKFMSNLLYNLDEVKIKKGNEIRNYANEGLIQLSLAFDHGQNLYKCSDNTWKDNLQTAINNSVKKDDYRVDWELIKHILSKDADAISETEYALVALVYINSDVDELEKFYKMCAAPEEYNSTEKLKELSGLGVYGPDVLIIDQKKVSNISQKVNDHQKHLLYEIKNGNYDPFKKDDLEKERSIALQRLTLATEMADIRVFYENPVIRGEDGSFFSFREVKGDGHAKKIQVDYKVITRFKIDYNNVGINETYNLETYEIIPRTATISDTYDHDHFSIQAIDEANNICIRRFTTSNVDIVASNGISAAAGETIFTSGVSLGVGIVEDMYENQENKETVEKVYDLSKVSYTIGKFILSGNIVTYETCGRPDDDVDVVLYEGYDEIYNYDTNDIINRYRMEDGINLTPEDVLGNPEKTFDKMDDHYSKYGDQDWKRKED